MNVLNLETRNDTSARHSEHASVYNAWANGLIKSASTSTCCANENVLLKETLLNYSSLRTDDYRTTNNFRNKYPSYSAVCIETPTLDIGETVGKNNLQVKLRLQRWTHFSDCNLNEIGLSASSHQRKPATFDGVRPWRESGAKSTPFSSHHNLDSILVNRSGNDDDGAILNFTAVNDHPIGDRVGLNGAAATRNGHRERAPLVYPKIAFLERQPSNSVLEIAAVESTSQMLGQSNSAPFKNDELLNDDDYLESGPFAKERFSAERHNDNVSEGDPNSQPLNFNDESFRIPSNDRTTNNATVIYNAVGNQSVTLSEQLPERQRKNGIFVHDFGNYNDANQPNNTKTTRLVGDIIIINDEEIAPPSSPHKVEKRPRRSSSLKMPKLNDSTPAQKKIVRFADALGLDLADVRTFLDELPSIPKSAYNDLQNDEPAEQTTTQQPRNMEPTKTLVPMFKQPHTSSNFLDRIRDNFVALEFAKVNPLPDCSISGTVRVRNLDFCKSVYVRYTMDNWRTFNDLQAVYVPDSCDGFSDKFAFVIYIYDMKANQRVELAVRFHCTGCIHWDNNNGSNYVFQCSPSATIIAPSYFYYYAANDDVSNSFF